MNLTIIGTGYVGFVTGIVFQPLKPAIRSSAWTKTRKK